MTKFWNVEPLSTNSKWDLPSKIWSVHRCFVFKVSFLQLQNQQITSPRGFYGLIFLFRLFKNKFLTLRSKLQAFFRCVTAISPGSLRFLKIAPVQAERHDLHKTSSEAEAGSPPFTLFAKTQWHGPIPSRAHGSSIYSRTGSKMPNSFISSSYLSLQSCL